MRGGETQIKAFSFYPEDEEHLRLIQNITQTNRSETVRMALLHYLNFLREEAEKNK